MKSLSKFLALILVIAMMASLLCIPGLADETEDPYAKLKEGTGYVAIGDSFTRGYGASDHWQSQLYENEYYGNYNCRNVDGSYPNGVAAAFGLNTPNDIRDTDGKLWPLAHDAVSTAYILDLLGIDDGFRDDEFTYQDGAMIRRYKTDLAYYGDPQSYTLDGTARYGKTGEIMSVRNMLENASLISIELGQADVIYKAQILGLNKIDLSDTANLPSAVADLVSMLYRYFEYWKGAYPLLLDYIKENNPDAKVVLVGTMNPVQNATLSEGVLAPIGSALNIIMDLMNKYNRECAEKYGYMYVDINNVDTPSTENEMSIGEILSIEDSIEFALMAHPTPNGYAQITRMVVEAVKAELAKDAAEEQNQTYVPDTPKTFIKVDLGRFQKVDYVMVDGNKIDNYTMDGYVLTIPCYNKLAKTLAVAIKNDDGTITLLTYTLQYNNGYTAHRTYETNDVAKTATTTVKTVTSVLKTAVTKAASLLKSAFGSLKK